MGGDRPNPAVKRYLQPSGSPAWAGIDRQYPGGSNYEAVGSPAWAGIDPVPARESMDDWFPRVGGDRPSNALKVSSGSSSTGSPAWAGIDPLPTRPASLWGWFPRVGGDRPLPG